ncbi:MAG: hypothetical protein RLZZ308_458 [Candidatus Parcubacteria bacterium]|jgi:dienelactone hydrolase
MIQEKIHTSHFGEGESEIFIYPSYKETNKVLFIIKGLYGEHRPAFDSSVNTKWDILFVNEFMKEFNVVCMNTSHKKNEVSSGRDDRKNAYDGKMFEEEVCDVREVINRAKQFFLSRGKKELELYFFGKSFGGTLLLGLQEVLEAKAIFMVGSGCGKSETTTKTLLKTMPKEVILLKNISNYTNGKLYFFRGGLDNVVPQESQEKIVNAVDKSKVEYLILKGVDHEFEKVNGVKSKEPTVFLLQKVSEVILNT